MYVCVHERCGGESRVKNKGSGKERARRARSHGLEQLRVARENGGERSGSGRTWTDPGVF